MMERKFLTLEEASDYLGLKKSTLYLYTHKRVIPFYKPRGRKVYFKISDLNNFLEQGRVKTQEEIEQEATNKLYEV